MENQQYEKTTILNFPELDGEYHELLNKTYEFTSNIYLREAELQEDFIKQITPKWWQWCILRGGILKWIASKLIKIIVVERK